jgi:hypothetical protein
VPWSQLGPEFALVWGRADPRNPQPEHIEIVGPNGTGKTYLLMTLLQHRQIVRDTPSVLIATKADDEVFSKLGWPVTDEWDGVRRNRQVIFWPRTKLLGRLRKQHHERKIRGLLERLWQPGANVLVAFDEVGWVENLSGELRDIVNMYWREARSQKITIAAMKQRPQGTQRDMHSETWWTASFKPFNRADYETFAELFGAKRDWIPVLDSLDPGKREFILQHSRTGQAYISWVDTPLRPVKPRGSKPRLPWRKQQEAA